MSVSPYREGAPILCELAILILSPRKTVWLSRVCITTYVCVCLLCEVLLREDYLVCPVYAWDVLWCVRGFVK